MYIEKEAVMFPRLISIPLMIVLAGGLMAAAAGPDAPTTESACTPVLGTTVCTWVVLDEGRATELGATIPMALIEGVPTDVEMVWPPRELVSVSFPEAARRALGIDHLGVNWEAHGHPPAAFVTQHFDFHFYNLTPEQVAAIDCSNEAKPAGLPTDYALPDISVPEMGTFIGLCVPAMGMHAMLEHEVHETETFEASMMMGYYAGAPIFFEPMVSRDLLLRRADFGLPVPAVEGLPGGVRYPRSFRAEYDASAEAYRLVFTQFYAD
jgi:hypothetical protein